jgi:hypothetical protein
MRSAFAVCVILAVVASVNAGCAKSTSGTPRAVIQEVDSPPGSTSAVPLPSPSRPRPVNLANVNPCQLLTGAQLASFAVDHGPESGTVSGGNLLSGSQYCNFGSDAEQYGFLIVNSASIGLPEFLARIGPRPSRRNIEVEHYPAVQEESTFSEPGTGNGVCFVHVDVADGQFLSVQFSQVSALPPKRLPIEAVCAMARAVAAASVTTLRGG